MTTIAVSQAPVDTHTADFGHLTLVASRTVDNGYALNVFTGPTRVPELCHSTGSREVFRAVYRLIAEQALDGQRPARIADALRTLAEQRVDRAMRGGNATTAGRTDLAAWTVIADMLRTPAEVAAQAALVARYHATAA